MENRKNANDTSDNKAGFEIFYISNKVLFSNYYNFQLPLSAVAVAARGEATSSYKGDVLLITNTQAKPEHLFNTQS